MKHNWEYRPFDGVAHTITPISKIEKSEYLSYGLVPIISQEETLISGYWDTSKDVTPHQKPVVIFGDHSRVLKYIDFEFVVGADGVKIIEPEDDINTKFLYYYLRWLNIPSLGYSRHFKLVKEALYAVPPKESQERIVAELNKINELIEQNRELLRNLDSLAQSLFYDTFGDPITNPKGWPVNQMSSACELVTDGTHFSPKSLPEGDYMYISAKNIKKDGLDLSNVTFVDAEIHKSIYRACPVKKGDILYIKDGATTGIAIINPIEDEFSLLSSVALLRANQRYICPIYIRDFLNCPTVYQLFRTRMGGAAITRLTLKKINSFKIPIPPLLLQEEYTTKVEAIEAQKATVEKSIAELQTLLDSRMAYWFN